MVPVPVWQLAWALAEAIYAAQPVTIFQFDKLI